MYATFSSLFLLFYKLSDRPCKHPTACEYKFSIDGLAIHEGNYKKHIATLLIGAPGVVEILRYRIKFEYH